MSEAVFEALLATQALTSAVSWDPNLAEMLGSTLFYALRDELEVELGITPF